MTFPLKTPHVKSVACLLMLLLAAGTAKANQVVSLENALLRAEWDAGRDTPVSLKDKTTGPQWLDPAMDGPSRELTLMEKDGKTRRTLAVPSVLHAVWKLADGRTGTIFACIHDKPVEFTLGKEKLTLAPGEALFRPSR